jgi:transposase/uncharacterized coiled-coil protein SlyX
MSVMTKAQLERRVKDLETRLSNQKVKAGEMPELIVMLQRSLVKSEELNAEQKEIIASLKKENSKLSESLEKAKELIRKLRALMKRDSSTSDKPPSTDVFKKPKPQSLRVQSGKKPGGQQGHTGHTLALYPEPTRIIDILPENCCHCGHAVELTGQYTAKQEADATLVVNIIEERAHEGICSCCGKRVSGSFSERFKNPVHYGDNLKALVALISEHGFVSVSKTAEIISSLTGGEIKLSWGTIINIQKELSSKLDDTIDTIRAGLLAGKVISGDETGCRVNGSLSWIQVFCNEDFALFGLNKKRGDIDDNLGMLAYFTGILIHDHWMSYYKYNTLTHAECNEHILRTIKGLAEIFKHGWLHGMSDLLKKACHEKNELMRSGFMEMSPERILEFSNEYDELLRQGWLDYEAAVAGSKRKASYHIEEKRLLTRLGEYKDEHLLFLNDFNAPFTNNLSEQSIRKYKCKLKAAGCFRSIEGAIIYARIASLITTLKKQNRNIYEGIRSVYAGIVPIASP